MLKFYRAAQQREPRGVSGGGGVNGNGFDAASDAKTTDNGDNGSGKE